MAPSTRRPTIKNMVTGAVALVRRIVVQTTPNIAHHTDHCPKEKLATYVRPLIDIERER